MADNLDTPSFGNFGIEDTMDMGVGNTQLLDDLFSPETSTGDPDKLETIVKTADKNSSKSGKLIKFKLKIIFVCA
jgi:hypothetical protein